MLLKNKFPQYNVSEQKGLIALISIIFILQLIYFFYPFSSNAKQIFDVDSPEVAAFQRKIDSLKKVEIENRKPQIYPFNPSFITDYKGSKLGMSVAEIDRLLAYRKKGKYINSAKEFQQITKISDSLLGSMAPYFKFPEWLNKEKNNSYKITPFNPSFLSKSKGERLGMSSTEIDKLLAHKDAGKYINSAKEFQEITGVNNALLSKIQPYFKFPDWVVAKNKREAEQESRSNTVFTGEKIELNNATQADLQKINGVGEKTANRILSYKKKLKGYTFNSQLNEVWGLKKEVANRILERYTVLTKPKISKVNINIANFKEVLHLPYIDYELTKKMFNLRDEVAELQSLEELKEIDSFPVDKFDRISLYLKAE